MGFDKNSVIFGIGLGFIVVSLVLYLGNNILQRSMTAVEYEISEQELIERARELGMIMADEQPKLTDEEIISRAQELGLLFETEVRPSPEPTSAVEPTPEPVLKSAQTDGLPAFVTVRIPPDVTASEIADLLKESGAVSDSNEFSDYLDESGGTVEEGIYLLPAGDYDRILDILLDR